ncbi:unnamed protein product [Polarella glacialis]|uniref:Transmembrane protein n=1 Tax=Polarella glacialis TaxID=89957 RepID=A0A813IET1_POLGL|nr:unnamed protein product [Polarella glacialis]CAE8649065.1 unnamed protein product [Polarella glacialis]
MWGSLFWPFKSAGLCGSEEFHASPVPAKMLFLRLNRMQQQRRVQNTMDDLLRACFLANARVVVVGAVFVGAVVVVVVVVVSVVVVVVVVVGVAVVVVALLLLLLSLLLLLFVDAVASNEAVSLLIERNSKISSMTRVCYFPAFGRFETSPFC